jgi:hypothetical protein
MSRTSKDQTKKDEKNKANCFSVGGELIAQNEDDKSSRASVKFDED